MLETLFASHPPIELLETVLTSPQAFPVESIEHKQLPLRQRFWKLPKGTPILPKEKESFSSLEGYLFNPYQWLLKYPAALKPSGILDISDSFLLYGTLAHDLAERLFRLPDALSMGHEDFDRWFTVNFTNLVSTEGVVLLMPGRGADLENFRQLVNRAMTELRQQLNKAGVVKVEPEIELTGDFAGGVIYGFADLVVTKADGKQAIVDLKWAGGKKYPDKLASNSHLQLGIYAELIRQRTDHWPEIAYFILSQSRLIAPNNHFFPDAQVVRKNKGLEDQNTPQLWEQFQNTWNWRKESGTAGVFELVIDKDDLEDGLTLWPEDGLAPEVLNQNYNETLILAGLKE
jgi:hypothetical protein